jgi:hypothetical protein
MVNLSARLMASAGVNEVYVDEATYNASEKGLDFKVFCSLYALFEVIPSVCLVHYFLF